MSEIIGSFNPFIFYHRIAHLGVEFQETPKGLHTSNLSVFIVWHECEQALRVGDGQGSLECCSPWGCKESDTTEWLN